MFSLFKPFMFKKKLFLSSQLKYSKALSLVRIMQFETEAMSLVADGAAFALLQHHRLGRHTSDRSPVYCEVL
jgi:hypothetical protein